MDENLETELCKYCKFYEDDIEYCTYKAKFTDEDKSCIYFKEKET